MLARRGALRSALLLHLASTYNTTSFGVHQAVLGYVSHTR